MPCRSDDYDVTYNHNDAEKKNLKKELDRVTRLLCFLTGTVHWHDANMRDLAFKQAPDLKTWWENHKESDEKRLVAEMKNYLNNKPNAKKADVVDLFIKKAEKVHAVSDFHTEWFFGSCFDKALESVQNKVDQIKKKLSKEEYAILEKHFKEKN